MIAVGREPYVYRSHRTRGVGTEREHVLVAERALGRPLPVGVEVHHVDGDGHNNRPTNLVLCQDRAYHMLLHYRTRAKQACGNANWHKCWVCKKYDAPERLVIYRRKRGNPVAVHAACNRSKWHADQQKAQRSDLR